VPTDAVEPRKKIRSEAVQSEQRRKADSAGGHLTSPVAALVVISPKTCGAPERQKKFQAASARWSALESESGV
jgi:hypothetical protein